MFKRKKRSFYLLLASFFIILLICFVLVAFLVFRNSGQMLNKAKHDYQQAAQKAMDSVALNLSDFEEYASLLASNSEDLLAQFSSMDYETIRSADFSSLEELFISTYVSQNKVSCAVPFLYFRQSDYAIRIGNTSDLIRDGEITQFLGLTQEDWNLLTDAADAPVAFIEQTDRMTFARLMLAEEIYPGTVLIYGIPAGTIIYQMNRHYLPENSWVMMFSSNDQFLLSDEMLPEDLNLSYHMLDENSGQQYLSASGAKYFLYDQTIPRTDLKMAVLILDELTLPLYRSAFRTLLIMFLLIFCVGGSLSWLFARKLYHPVSALLSHLPVSELEDQRDDLQQIQYFVDSLVNRNETYEGRIQKQRRLLSASLFLRLLDRTLNMNADIEKYLAESGFPVAAERYILLQFTLTHPEDTLLPTSSLMDSLAFCDALRGQFNSQDFDAFVVSCADSYLALVDLTGQEKMPDFNQIHHMKMDGFALHLLISVSEPFTSFEDLPTAYTQVTYVSDYLMLSGLVQKTETYHDLLSAHVGSSKDSSFLSAVHRLANQLQSGSYTAGEAELDIIFSSLAESGSRDLCRSRISYLLDTLHLAIAGSDLDSQKVQELFAQHSIDRNAGLSLLRRQIGELLEQLPSCVSETPRDTQLIQEIRNYLKDHCTDSTLSAGVVAEQFHVSLPWLSIHFKSETGTGFLDYLHRCRLWLAKKKLTETDDNIQDLAIACGYTSAATFSRTFRRYEGVTPSWYRQSHRKFSADQKD